MTEKEEGFAEGIEAAVDVAWAHRNEPFLAMRDAIRNLKPAPRSAEHTGEPSAQGERERFEELLDSFAGALYRHEWCCDKKDALVAMFRAALATAPSPRRAIVAGPVIKGRTTHWYACPHCDKPIDPPAPPSPRIEALPEDPQYDKAGEIPAMNAKEAEFGHLGFRGGWIAGRDWEKACNASIEAEPVGESDSMLVERAVRNARHQALSKWGSVMAVFGLGSTRARELCRRFGFEPDDGADTALSSQPWFAAPPDRSTSTSARKVGGSYEADGWIIACFATRAGEERVVFEFAEPKGMLHIFRPDQLTDRTPDAPRPSQADWGMLEARSTSDALGRFLDAGADLEALEPNFPGAYRKPSDAAVVLPELPRHVIEDLHEFGEVSLTSVGLNEIRRAAVETDRATRSTDSSVEAAGMERAAKILEANPHTFARHLIAKVRAEAAKLPTAPHTADETRVGGGAT